MLLPGSLCSHASTYQGSVASAGGEASVAGGTAPISCRGSVASAGGEASVAGGTAPISCRGSVASAGGEASVAGGTAPGGNYSTERGVFLPAFALWVAVAVLCAVLVVGVSARASERAKAQSFADAVALAGAAEGAGAAAEIAMANGAEVVSYRENGNAVEVTVEAFGVQATAAAERQIRPAE